MSSPTNPNEPHESGDEAPSTGAVPPSSSPAGSERIDDRATAVALIKALHAGGGQPLSCKERVRRRTLLAVPSISELVLKNGKVIGWNAPGRSRAGRPLSKPPAAVESERLERKFLAANARLARLGRLPASRASASMRRREASERLLQVIRDLETKLVNRGAGRTAIIAKRLGLSERQVRRLRAKKNGHD